jgi:hypothetical protein
MKNENVISKDYLIDVYEMMVEYMGYSYRVIFGHCMNGGFFCIPNWGVSGELADFKDIFWNTESITRSLKKKKVAKIIALAIAEF